MDPLALHSVFDLLAWAAAALMAVFIGKWRPQSFPVTERQRTGYFAALIFCSALGAYFFGTLNLYVSGQPGLARSIEGAIFGAVLGVEGYKRAAGIGLRTGARFAAPLAVGVAVGRIGCFLSGLPDFTYGTPTDSPFGVDFGDHIHRHPVQLYESAAMALFLAIYLALLAARNQFAAKNGLYLAILFYAAQRFLWEFLKPYGAVLGPFTAFHLLSLALAAYAIFMLRTRESADA